MAARIATSISSDRWSGAIGPATASVVARSGPNGFRDGAWVRWGFPEARFSPGHEDDTGPSERELCGHFAPVTRRGPSEQDPSALEVHSGWLLRGPQR
jgi:hypothetical protein